MMEEAVGLLLNMTEELVTTNMKKVKALSVTFNLGFTVKASVHESQVLEDCGTAWRKEDLSSLKGDQVREM